MKNIWNLLIVAFFIFSNFGAFAASKDEVTAKLLASSGWCNTPEDGLEYKLSFTYAPGTYHYVKADGEYTQEYFESVETRDYRNANGMEHTPVELVVAGSWTVRNGQLNLEPYYNPYSSGNVISNISSDANSISLRSWELYRMTYAGEGQNFNLSKCQSATPTWWPKK